MKITQRILGLAGAGLLLGSFAHCLAQGPVPFAPFEDWKKAVASGDQAALAKLSPELRETVILRDIEELEYREIAQVLKVPEGTVKSRLNRGRAELARILRKQRILI